MTEEIYHLDSCTPPLFALLSAPAHGTQIRDETPQNGYVAQLVRAHHS